jgi:hypothetical protein
LINMLSENQKIKVEESDAPEFIEIVNKIMGIMVFQYDIGEVVFVKIRNWFDHKWLNYSGNAVISFNSGGLFPIDQALESKWMKEITIPPFNPHRVIYSRFFKRKHTDNHRIERAIQKYQHSNDNIHNTVADYTSDGLIVWFSSNTEINQKGSLMIYRSQNNKVHTWYASLENQKE